MCMKYYWGNDSGLAEEFRDSQFDARWHSVGLNQPFEVSNQIGHFLTAVALFTLRPYAFLQLGLRLTVGHEKLADQQPGASEAAIAIRQLLAASDQDISQFCQAATIDGVLDTARDGRAISLRAERDLLLWQILAFDPAIPFADIDLRRPGNSLQDLRLSVKGYRFAAWVNANRDSRPAEAGAWLRAQLAPRTNNAPVQA
jgi:hypothetical protein